jgi:hypothetical protein
MKKWIVLIILLIASNCFAYTETFYLTATGSGTKSGTSLANAMSPTEFNTAGNWDTDNSADGKIGIKDKVIIN